MSGIRILAGMAAVLAPVILMIVFMSPGFTGRIVDGNGRELIEAGKAMTIGRNSVIFSNPEGFQSLEFRMRVDDDLGNHASWQAGGFAGQDTNPTESSDPRAVFYVDVGLMKAFVRDSGGILWCRPIERDWTAEHVLRIETGNGTTRFMVDGMEECVLGKSAEGLPVMFSEDDPVGGIETFIRDARLF